MSLLVRTALAVATFLLVWGLLSLPAFADTGTRTSGFTYDSGTGLLTSETVEPGDSALAVTTTYTYDAYGNITQASVSGSGITSRSTGSTFDTKGRFALTTTNALSQSESVTYDERFGLPLTQTGPNGLTTTWSYDDLGRKTLEVLPDGTRTAFSYAYCSGVNGGSATCPTYGAYVMTATPYASDGTTQIGPQAKSYFDALGRAIAADTQGFDGGVIRQATVYDALGRTEKTSRPYFLSGGTPKWTLMEYDALGRPTDTEFPDGSSMSYAYHGLTTSTTNDLSQTETTVKDSQGNVVTSTDAASNSTTFAYDAFGNLLSTTDSEGNVSTATYDIRGRKLSADDPDLGEWSYSYNVLGELVSQTDAKSQTVTLEYDLLGRLIERVEDDLTSTWEYDTAANGVGKLASTSASSGYDQELSYDSLGRPYASTTTIDGVTATTTTSYDANSRVHGVEYPSGFTVEYGYTALGYQNTLTDTGTSTVLWTANARDAELHLLTQTAGNGIVTAQAFNANTGLLSTIKAGPSDSVADFSYSFDTIGNLTARGDATQSLIESFAYDGLNRLTGYQVSGQAAKTMTYDDLGNILSKSDTGTYSYPASGQPRPHAVSSITGTFNATYTYDAVGNLTSDGTRTLTWTSFNMVTSIAQGANTVVWQYDTAHMRTLQEDASGRTLYFTDPVSGIKIEKFIGAGGASQWNEYLIAGGQMVGEHFTKTPSGGTPVTEETRYFVTDHLGSISVLTDETGAIVERLSYDAWGKRRHPDGTDDPTGSITSQTTRGFTGHEMIDAVGLVNMNGRIYDPRIGKMLSADPFIPEPLDTQSLNRYAYVTNNPLTLTDMTGYFSFKKLFKFTGLGLTYQLKKAVHQAAPIVGQLESLAAGIVCGIYGGPAAAAGCASAVTAINTGIAGGSLKEVLIAGTITFAQVIATAGVGDVFGSAAFGSADFSWGSYAGSVGAHAVVGGAFSAAQGGSFGSGALAGAFSAAAGPIDLGDIAANFVLHASIGGAGSVLGGGKFLNGAVTGSFVYGFNHLGHMLIGQDAHRVLLEHLKTGDDGAKWTGNVGLGGTFNPGRPDLIYKGEWDQLDVYEVKKVGSETVGSVQLQGYLATANAHSDVARAGRFSLIFRYSKSITLLGGWFGQTTYTFTPSNYQGVISYTYDNHRVADQIRDAWRNTPVGMPLPWGPGRKKRGS